MSYRVEPVTLARLDSHRWAVDAVARERRWLMLVEAPPPEQVEAFVRGNIESGRAQFVVIDEATDANVGWANVTPGDRPGVTHVGRLGMGVVAAHRGNGLGRRLLDATLAAAWATGLRRIKLEVYASNAAAVRLYESAGFEREGVRRMARLLDGRPQDVVGMAMLR